MILEEIAELEKLAMSTDPKLHVFDPGGAWEVSLDFTVDPVSSEKLRSMLTFIITAMAIGRDPACYLRRVSLSFWSFRELSSLLGTCPNSTEIIYRRTC